MSRPVDDAHYLHQRRGLTPLVRPPVQHATHMAWDGKGALLVATADGRVERVHPAMGTTTVLSDLRAPAGLGVSGDRFVVVEHGGAWATYALDGEKLIEGRHPFEGAVTVQFREGKVLLTGLTKGEKQVLFYDSGRKVLRIQLPPRAVAFISNEHIGLAQSADRGLETIYLRDGGRFHGAHLTPHALFAFHEHIVGVHVGGARVWSIREGEYVDVTLSGTTTATLTEDARFLALGTADGSVGLVALEADADRREPFLVEAGSSPIRAIAFSRKGRYLATGAEGLIIWTWE